MESTYFFIQDNRIREKDALSFGKAWEQQLGKMKTPKRVYHCD